jgi:hypothetical protein
MTPAHYYNPTPKHPVQLEQQTERLKREVERMKTETMKGKCK